MAHTNSQWISHTIEGGWATDYGNTLYASPQNGQLTIPWCTTCENIRFYPDGSFGKYPGVYTTATTPIKAPATSSGFIESSIVKCIFDYVRMGTTLTGTRKRMVVVGSWLYDISSLSEPILIGDVGGTAINGGLYHMATFNDLLIVGGATLPKSWDQTTFQSLAGSPPAFLFSTPHAGRHWAAGIAANPSRLYYSAVGNPEDWTGSGSGSIDIDPGDGDGIVGLLSWKRELWVFKGPNRLSIHRITGTSPSDFAREPFVYGISAAGPNCIFPVGDDFGFWSPRGTCHSLSATAAYGDYIQAYLNFPILSWCRNPANLNGGLTSNTWQTVTDHSQNTTYTLFNNSLLLAGTLTTYLIVMDWRFRSDTNPYPRFLTLNFNTKLGALGMTSGIFDTNQLFPTFGNRDGIITQELSPTLARFYNNGSVLPYRLVTPALTYGPTHLKKTISSVSVDLADNFNPYNSTTGVLEFSYGGRGASAQTIDFEITSGVGLDTFVLDQDQLDSGANGPGFSEATVGESTAFTYTLVEQNPLVSSVGTDARVHHFNVLITPSGESLENP